MLKIRYSLASGMLSGWTDQPDDFDALVARQGEATVTLDQAMPATDDYENYAYLNDELVSSGKPEPVTRVNHTFVAGGSNANQRLSVIETFLEEVYP